MCLTEITSRVQRTKNLIKSIRAIFPVCKEKGLYSRDVVDMLYLQINDDLNARIQTWNIKILTAGTLEKEATGVLICGIGSSVKELPWFRIGKRKYAITGHLGVQTSTWDTNGMVVEEKPFDHVTLNKLNESLTKFIGEYKQIRAPFETKFPKENPDSSEPILPVTRPSICYSINCKDFSPPKFSLELECGGAFQVRSFIHQLGEDLGTCAHVGSLHRVQHGPFTLHHALLQHQWSWKQISEFSENNFHLWRNCLKEIKEEFKEKPYLREGSAIYK